MSLHRPLIRLFSTDGNIPRKRLMPLVRYASIALGAFSAGYFVTSYQPRSKKGSMPYDAEIDKEIEQMPLFQQLHSSKEWIGSRPHLLVSDPTHNFSAGVLSGPGKISVPPWIFWKGRQDGEEDQKWGESVAIGHLGDQLCGYEGIVHGGVIATMFDEVLARTCFPVMPNKIAMTAQLTVNYLKPTRENQYIVLRAKTTKLKGRKCWVEGRLETLEEHPQILAQASGLFVEPRMAKYLKSVIPDI